MDTLSNLLNLKCLSDLHYINRKDLHKVLKVLWENNYSLRDWNYTLSYIYQKQVNMRTLEEVHTFLMYRSQVKTKYLYIRENRLFCEKKQNRKERQEQV